MPDQGETPDLSGMLMGSPLAMAVLAVWLA